LLGPFEVQHIARIRIGSAPVTNSAAQHTALVTRSRQLEHAQILR
jgi:hypothetical protein